MTRGDRPTAAAAGSDRLDRYDLLSLGGLTLLGGLLRAAYLTLLEVPLYDPWRHLLLVRNLRDGLGFTLFDGQPYLWYSPLWYQICAALPRGVGMEWLAGLFSWLSVPLTWLLLRRGLPGGGRRAALAGGLLMAACGPIVRFTCHYGAEGLALFLCLAALLLVARRPGTTAGLVGGLAVGVAMVLRLNFGVCALLCVPFLRNVPRASAFLVASAAPLALTWWRNHRIIGSHEWLFTWDGLATRSADFNLLSTLVPQMHPALRDGLRRLHETVVPAPEWLRGPDGIAWMLILFVVCGLAAVSWSRRGALVLATGAALAYFLVLDRSLSSNFFRVWLPVFPCFVLAASLAVARHRQRTGRTLAWLLVAGMLVGGAGMLRPVEGPPLAMVTPPEEPPEAPCTLVNSGFYHPESLLYRFPGRVFLGLPLEPGQLEEFLAAHPSCEQVLWHDFSVQGELADHLVSRAGFEVSARQVNRFGRGYVLLRPRKEKGLRDRSPAAPLSD